MNDRMNESLSALLDGEADELEVRRLLNQSEQDDELRNTWQRYQMIGAAMRGEPVMSVDLSRGIRQALEGEPMDEIQTRPLAAQPTSHWRWLAASGAVAASVMMAVVVGVQWQAPGHGAQVAESTAVASPAAVQLAAAPVSAEQQAQLEEAQRKLQQYVLQHSEQATDTPARAMSPLARTVNFSQEDETRP